jgi:DNA-binding winged helix-turn-helix (wHTH) protein
MASPVFLTTRRCPWRRGDAEDGRILLTLRAFAVLRYPVEHAGLVTRHELIATVWPDTYWRS